MPYARVQLEPGVGIKGIDGTINEPSVNHFIYTYLFVLA